MPRVIRTNCSMPPYTLRSTLLPDTSTITSAASDSPIRHAFKRSAWTWSSFSCSCASRIFKSAIRPRSLNSGSSAGNSRVSAKWPRPSMLPRRHAFRLERRESLADPLLRALDRGEALVERHQSVAHLEGDADDVDAVGIVQRLHLRLAAQRIVVEAIERGLVVALIERVQRQHAAGGNQHHAEQQQELAADGPEAAPHGCRRRHFSMAAASCSPGTAMPISSPCARVQPSSASICHSSTLRTPSATVVSFSL